MLLFLLLGGGHGVISAFLTGLDDLVKTRGFSKGDGHRFRSFAGMMTCACSSLMRCIPTQYIGQKTCLDLWCRLWVPRPTHVCNQCFPHKMLCILPVSSYSSLTIDHLHNYGPGTRFGASSARIGCDVCVPHSSFRFSSALECHSAITVVFLAVLIEAGLVLYSSLIVFGRQVSSGSAGFLPFVRLTDWTSASPAAHGLMNRALPP